MADVEISAVAISAVAISDFDLQIVIQI